MYVRPDSNVAPLPCRTQLNYNQSINRSINQKTDSDRLNARSIKSVVSLLKILARQVFMRVNHGSIEKKASHHRVIRSLGQEALTQKF